MKTPGSGDEASLFPSRDTGRGQALRSAVCLHGTDSIFLLGTVPQAFGLSVKEKYYCLYRELKSGRLAPNVKKKIKLLLCLTNYALRHEDVWESGCIDPRIHCIY
jgi:hypothetical protein